MYTHNDAMKVARELFTALNKFIRGPEPRLQMSELRRLNKPNFLDLAREVVETGLNIDLSGETHARRRNRFEASTRLATMDFTIFEMASHLDLMMSSYWPEITKKAALERQLLARSGLEYADRLDRLPTHSAIFHWLDNQLYHSADEPVYIRPTLGLAYRLMLTETKKVRGVDLKFPFPGFHVLVPPKLIYMHHEASGEHEVTHLSVAESVVTAEIAEKLGLPPAGYPLRSLVVVVRAKNGDRSNNDFDFMHTIVNAPLTDEPPQNKADDYGSMRIGASVLGTVAFTDFVISYVTNLLLYISSGGELVLASQGEIDRLEKKIRSSKKPRKTDLARLRKAKASSIYTVGTTIGIDPELERAVRTGQSTGPNWSLTYKTLVRGHWRNQPWGPGREFRRMVWIEPHTRGPGFADQVVSHTYNVT